MEKSFLANEKISSLMLRMTIPAILSMTISAVYNFVDRIYIGKLDPLALTAVGLSMPIQIIIMSFVLLIGIGSASLVSLRLGSDDKETAERILANAFSILLLTLSMVCIVCQVFIDDILRFIGTSENVLEMTRTYTSIIIIGSPMTLIGFGLNHSLRARGDAKLSMYIIVSSAIINMVLDPVLIFTFDLGISGAALATIISQGIASTLILYKLASTNTDTLKLKFKYTSKLDAGLIKPIFENGVPVFMMQAIAIIVNIALNRSIVKYGGDISLASFTIISSVFQVYHMVLVGIIQGNQPIIGFNYGAGFHCRVLKTLNLSVRLSTAISVTLWLVVMIFPESIASIFTSETGLISSSVTGLRLYFMVLPVVGFQFIIAQYFQAIANPKKATVLLLLRFGLLLLPLLLIIPKYYGIYGVWYSIIASDLISAIIAFVFLKIETTRLKSLI